MISCVEKPVFAATCQGQGQISGYNVHPGGAEKICVIFLE